MRYAYICLLLASLCFLFSGCPNGEEGNPTQNTETPTPTPEDTPSATSVYYTANIVVENNDSEEYRLYIGTSDNLYNADTEIVDLNEGEIFIPSIPGSSTSDPYELDLGTNPTLGKDWVMQYYDTFFVEWSIVICTPIQDADGYVFEGNESYTITIESTANITIQKDI